MYTPEVTASHSRCFRELQRKQQRITDMRVMLLVQLHILLYSVLIEGNRMAEQRLLAHVLTDYNKLIRPGGDSGETLDVRVHVALHQIILLKPEAQSLQTLVVLTAEWYEEALSWTPSLYNGTNHMVLPASEIWLPDFGIENSAEEFYYPAAMEFRLLVSHTGLVTWSFGGHVKTKCSIEVNKFPFDDQICDFSLINWMYDEDAVNLSTTMSRLDMDEYVDNVEWDLIDSSCERKQVVHHDRDGRVYPSIVCRVMLSRKATFYIINLFAPSYFILFLFLISFCLPPGHRAIVFLQMTTLLIYSVLLLRISDVLPHTDHVPNISVFALVVTGLATLSVTSTVCISIIRIYMDTSMRVPQLVRRLAFDYLARPLCLRSIQEDLHNMYKLIDERRPAAGDGKTLSDTSMITELRQVSYGNDESNIECADPIRLLNQILDNSRLMVKHLKQIEGNTNSNSWRRLLRYEWDFLSMVTSRACFCLILCCVMVLTIKFILEELAPGRITL